MIIDRNEYQRNVYKKLKNSKQCQKCRNPIESNRNSTRCIPCDSKNKNWERDRLEKERICNGYYNNSIGFGLLLRKEFERS